jgi:hypothetical protein
MKLLAKVGLIALVGGGVTALYAAPGSFGGTPAMEQARARVQILHERVFADAQHVQHLQQVARREKDVIKLNCVNDKLVQIKPLMNVIDSSQASLDLDPSTSLTMITQAGESIRRLREEADQCIGEPVLGNESSNTYSHPGVFDPTGLNPWGNGIEPPAYASPYN